LSGKKDSNKKSRRRKKDNENGEEMEDVDEDEVEPEKEELKPQVTSDDGIFKVTVGPSIAVQNTGNTSETLGSSVTAFIPAPRMSAGLAYKQGKLYLYGGQYEEGDKQLTFSDLYSLGKQTLQFT
jgi:hypothetical protein